MLVENLNIYKKIVAVFNMAKGVFCLGVLLFVWFVSVGWLVFVFWGGAFRGFNGFVV